MATWLLIGGWNSCVLEHLVLGGWTLVLLFLAAWYSNSEKQYWFLLYFSAMLERLLHTISCTLHPEFESHFSHKLSVLSLSYSRYNLPTEELLQVNVVQKSCNKVLSHAQLESFSSCSYFTNQLDYCHVQCTNMLGGMTHEDVGKVVTEQ